MCPLERTRRDNECLDVSPRLPSVTLVRDPNRHRSVALRGATAWLIDMARAIAAHTRPVLSANSATPLTLGAATTTGAAPDRIDLACWDARKTVSTLWCPPSIGGGARTIGPAAARRAAAALASQCLPARDRDRHRRARRRVFARSPIAGHRRPGTAG
jgi:hypothetical protein